MALRIRDEDSLDLIAAKYIFSELVFAPVDALIKLVDEDRLSAAAGHTAILSVLNSVPEFVAKCHGEKGSLPTFDKWNLKGSKYLYVFGIYKLGLISNVRMILNFQDYAGLMYHNLRCDIAHAIVSGKVSFFKEEHGDFPLFAYHLKDQEKGITKENISEIADFICFVPTVYDKIRAGVEKYIARLETGEAKLHLENANKQAWYSPGFSGYIEREKGFLFHLEKVKEYWPDHFLNK